MVRTVFSAVLNMSITAGAVIVCVLAARMLLRRAPKIFSYALWVVVLFRLLCPVSPSSGFSLLGVFRTPAAETGQMEYLPMPSDNLAASPVLDEPETVTEPEIVPAEPLPQSSSEAGWDLLTVASRVWAAGLMILLSVNLIQLFRLRRTLVGAVKLRDNVYLADRVDTPFVLGLLQPRIYLPSALPPAERDYIIRHEQHHIRRGDPWIRALAFAALCIHWFNPLVWLAFALSGRDMEMSCDEAVMKEMGPDIRAAYSSSLLRLSVGKSLKPGTPLAFGTGDTKQRIRNIMNYRKPALWAVAAAVVLCVVLTACLGVNPRKASDPTPPPAETTNTTAEDSEDTDDTSIPSEAADPGLFRDILTGGADFVDAWTKEPVSLADLSRLVTSDPNLSVTAEAYTVLDLDQDGSPELVLRPDAADIYGFVVLHAVNDTIYGYHVPYRAFNSLKSDGTFSFSSGAGNSGIGTLVFGDDACETAILALRDTTYGDDVEPVVSCTVNGQSSSSEDFEMELERQAEKPDAVWYAMSKGHTVQAEAQVYNGYITALDPTARQLEFDSITYLTEGNDDEQLQELGIDPESLPNGYYLYNPEE